MGRLVGTVAFMAPEHIMGEDLDIRADLYSLGALLYMSLTGKKPFESNSIAGYLSMHLTKDPPRPRDIDPNAPQLLEQICVKLMQKDPKNRYNTAEEVLQVLNDKKHLPKIVGRTAELATFQRLLDTLPGDKLSLICIEGPEQAGKSFLLERLSKSMEAKKMSVSPWLANEDTDVVIVDDADKLNDTERSALMHQLRNASGKKSLYLVSASQKLIDTELIIALITHT